MPVEFGDWIALQVRVASEEMVNASLLSKGYEVFLPTWRRRQSARRNVKPVPLFPGYLFCRWSPLAGPKIVCTPNVVRVVGTRHAPIAVPEVQITSIRTLTESQETIYPWNQAVIGAMVRIWSGPLRGAVGRFVRVGARGHLVVSVDILCRTVTACVDEECVGAL